MNKAKIELIENTIKIGFFMAKAHPCDIDAVSDCIQKEVVSLVEGEEASHYNIQRREFPLVVTKRLV